MLMLTPTAVEAVREITSSAGAPQEAGLRISTAEEPESFHLTVATGPFDDDEVVNAGGARIFLDHGSAVYFDDKVLDAGLDATGNPSFVIGPQPIDG